MAVLLILMTIFMILNADASTEARGITRNVPIEMLVLGDLAALTGFSILISIGIASRHRPGDHLAPGTATSYASHVRIHLVPYFAPSR